MSHLNVALLQLEAHGNDQDANLAEGERDATQPLGERPQPGCLLRLLRNVARCGGLAVLPAVAHLPS